jgi:hypothetical protein
MSRPFRKGTLGALVLTMVLAGCGASNSVAGSSATNCLVPLESAIHALPVARPILGVRAIRAGSLHRLRFGARAGELLCVIGFSLPIHKHSGSSKRPIRSVRPILFVVYQERTDRLLGSAVLRSSLPEIRHFF